MLVDGTDVAFCSAPSASPEAAAASTFDRRGTAGGERTPACASGRRHGHRRAVGICDEVKHDRGLAWSACRNAWQRNCDCITAAVANAARGTYTGLVRIGHQQSSDY